MHLSVNVLFCCNLLANCSACAQLALAIQICPYILTETLLSRSEHRRGIERFLSTGQVSV